jgi:hypothetical protein
VYAPTVVGARTRVFLEWGAMIASSKKRFVIVVRDRFSGRELGLCGVDTAPEQIVKALEGRDDYTRARIVDTLPIDADDLFARKSQQGAS